MKIDGRNIVSTAICLMSKYLKRFAMKNLKSLNKLYKPINRKLSKNKPFQRIFRIQGRSACYHMNFDENNLSKQIKRYTKFWKYFFTSIRCCKKTFHWLWQWNWHVSMIKNMNLLHGAQYIHYTMYWAKWKFCFFTPCWLHYSIYFIIKCYLVSWVEESF